MYKSNSGLGAYSDRYLYLINYIAIGKGSTINPLLCLYQTLCDILKQPDRKLRIIKIKRELC